MSKNLPNKSTLVKIGEASKLAGVSIDTLRRWEKRGWIKALKTPGGTRFYDLNLIKKINPTTQKGRAYGLAPHLRQTAQDQELSNESSATLSNLDIPQSPDLTYTKHASDNNQPQDLIKDLSERKFEKETQVYIDHDHFENSLQANKTKHAYYTTALATFAGILVVASVLTFGIITSYLLKPDQTKTFFSNTNPFSPFNSLALNLIRNTNSEKYESLGLEKARVSTEISQNTSKPINAGSVLAESTPSADYLEINIPTKVNNSLDARTLHVSGTAAIDGAVTLNTVTYNFPGEQGEQTTFLSNDGAGNLTWSAVPQPGTATNTTLGIASFSSTNFTVTSGAVSITDGSITNDQLEEDSITINTSGDLSGGGSVSLGGSITLTATSSGGDITGVTAGSGLTGGGASGAVTLDILLTTSGSTGATSSNSGLEVSASGLTLLKGCSDTEVLKWSSGSAEWACANGGGSFTLAGDSGSSQTISASDTLTVAGGTNGIDTAAGATDTITLNLDTTEIGTATFGSGSPFTWTFDAGSSDPIIGFTSNQISLGSAVQGTITAFTVIDNPAITATANQNFFKTLIDNTAAVTVAGATTSSLVATLGLDEPNITATGTVTNAATLYLSGAPTEGSSGNFSIWVDDGESRFENTPVSGSTTGSALTVVPQYVVEAADLTLSGIKVSLDTNSNTDSGDIAYGVNIDDITTTAGPTEYGLRIGSGYDYQAYFELGSRDLRLSVTAPSAGTSPLTLTVPAIAADDTFCIRTLGNCFGAGSSGVTYTGQTTNAITRFTSNAGEITSAGLLDDGSTFTFSANRSIAMTAGTGSFTQAYQPSGSTGTANAHSITSTFGIDATDQTLSGLFIDADTNSNADSGDTLYGVNIDAITASSATEYGLAIGNGWDTNLFFNDTTTRVAVADGGSITILDTAGNTLCTVTDSGSTGDLSCTGNLTGGSGGTSGFWTRTGTNLSPATAGDDIVLTDDDTVGLGSGAATIEFDNQSTDEINFLNANVGIGDSTPDATFDIDSSATTGANFGLTNTGVYTGTGIFNLTANSATTGTLALLNANGLTSGKMLSLSSTSTALTGSAGAGSLVNLDWSPGSATTATGDLFALNIGANGTTTGNLFNILDSGSSIFSISETQLTTSLPAQFNSPGDVEIAYDLNFTNPTASYINSLSSLTLKAGESFNASDLTLQTYNQGTIVFNTTTTTGTSLDYTNTTLTSGIGFNLAGSTSTGITGSLIKAASDIGSLGSILYLTPDYSGSGVTGYGIRLTGTDSTNSANSHYNLLSTLALTGNANKTGRALYSEASTTSTTADTIYAGQFVTAASGIIGSGTRTNYGVYSQAGSSSANTGGTQNIYGIYSNPFSNSADGSTENVYAGYFKASGTLTSGTLNSYGVYIANPSMNTTGTTSKYGLYIENLNANAADNNIDINFAGTAPKIRIGDTGVLTFTEAGGNNTLCTITDNSNVGDLTCTGSITGASTGTVGYWSRSGTTLTTATAADNVTVDGTLDANGTFTIGDGGDTGAISSTTLDIDATGALQINSSGGAISIGNDSVSQAINIGTAGDRTITVGSISGATQTLVYGGTGGTQIRASSTTTDAVQVIGLALTNASALGVSSANDPSGAGPVNANYFDINNNNSGSATTLVGLNIGFTNTPTVSGNTEYAVKINNVATTNTTDNTVDALLWINNADTSASGSTVVTDGLRIDCSPTSNTISGCLTNGLTIASGGGSITTALNLADTDIVTDIVLQNSETIDNDTNGTINFAVSATSALKIGAAGITSLGNVAHSIIDSSGALAIDSNSTGAINIGTGANAKTITVGNATGATALVFNSGTGSQTHTSQVVSGTTTTSGFVFDATAITTGTGMYVTTDSITQGKLVNIATTGNTLTTGTLLNLSTTATSLTGAAGTGSLMNLDWSPGSSTTATGDLFALNIGSNGTTTGNLFNILDSSSSIFSVSETAFTTSLPSSFTSAGDVSIAYDINFTNPTASYIKSIAPITIVSGDIPNSSNLTLQTYNQGTIVLSTANTTTTAVDLSNSTITTGTGFAIALSGSSQTSGSALTVTQSGTTTGYTGNFVSLTGSSTTGTGNLLGLTAVNTTNGAALNITSNALTTGNGLVIGHTTSAITTGSLLKITSSSTDLLATNGLVSIAHSGAFTSTSNVGLLNITSSNASQVSGTALNVVQSGTTTGYTGNFVNFTGSSTTGAGNLLNLTSVNTTDGAALHIDANGITTGEALEIAHTTSVIASGGSLVSLSSTSADTGTTTGNVLDITSSGTTTGTVARIGVSNASQVSSTALSVVQSGVTTGYTGDFVSFTGSSTTGAGNLLKLTSVNTTGGAALAIVSDAVTSGKSVNISADALTSGSAFYLQSTSTALAGTATTGDGLLGNFDWLPGSSTTATGDLFRLHIGPNGTTTGSLFNIVDDTSSIFSVKETAFETSLPSNFTAAGDVAVAYDLVFTNPTASTITSSAPLTIRAGETFNSSNLVLSTYNFGTVNIDSTVSSGSGTKLNLYSTVSDSTTNANVVVGVTGGVTLTGDAAKTSYGVHGVVTSTSATGDTLNGLRGSVIHTGATTSGNKSLFGVVGAVTNSAPTDTNAATIYGGFFSATGNTGGTGSTSIGVYGGASGSDNNYPFYMGTAPSTANTTALCWDNSGESAIYDCNGSATDLAENFGASDSSIEAGDLVISDPNRSAQTIHNIDDEDNVTQTSKAYVVKTQTPYDSRVLGIISTQPNQVYGDDGVFDPSENPRPVSLAGRVPVKVSTENGPIKKGDYLTTSSQAGVAMKATRPGATVGKALEDFNSSGVGKIITFVNVGYADPSDALANLLIGNNGQILSSNISAQTLTLSSDLTSGGIVKANDFSINASSINLTGALAGLPQSSGTISLSDAIEAINQQTSENADQLMELAAQQASNSAQIAQTLSQTNSLSEAMNTTSSAISSLTDQINNLFASLGENEATDSGVAEAPQNDITLTDPTIMFATDSATLANLEVTSEATISGRLTAYQTTIQDTFKALGESFLSKTTIAGDLTVDGTLSITEGSKINALPILYIQDNPLAEAVNFFNGKAIITKDGIIAATEVVADQFKVNENKSSGVSTLQAGQTELAVFNQLVKSNSIIILTPENLTSQPLVVTDKVLGAGFVVKVSTAQTQDVKFSYLIIGQEQASQ